MDAIEEYKEVSERYEFLNAQVQDVEVSKDELLALIGELTVQMREIFIERFKQINYNYGIVFAEMFAGGKGELKLSDPDDILHSGIEMHVQPPGQGHSQPGRSVRRREGPGGHRAAVCYSESHPLALLRAG